MALIDGIKAYYKLGETSGTRYDETDANLDLTDIGTTGYTSSGLIGNAAVFNGSSQYLKKASASIGDTSRTWNAWIKLDVNNVEQTIICYSTYNDISSYSFSRLYVTSSGKLAYDEWYRQAFFGYPNTVTGTTTLPTGEWVMVSITATSGTFEGGATYKLYINGAVEKTQANEYRRNSMSTDLVLGVFYNYSAAGGTAAFFDGGIDEVGLWDETKTDQQVVQLYRGAEGNQYPFLAHLFTYPEDTVTLSEVKGVISNSRPIVTSDLSVLEGLAYGMNVTTICNVSQDEVVSIFDGERTIFIPLYFIEAEESLNLTEYYSTERFIRRHTQIDQNIYKPRGVL